MVSRSRVESSTTNTRIRGLLLKRTAWSLAILNRTVVCFHDENMMSPDKKPAHHHLPIIFSIDSAAMPTALSFRFLGLALCLGILLPITLPGQAPADPPSMMGGKGKGKGKGKG